MTEARADRTGDGADGGRCTNPKCGVQVEAGAQRCWKCGRVQPRNTLSRKSGVYARFHPAGLRHSVDELMAGITEDRGGEAELSTLEASYVRKIGDVEIVIRLLTADISRRGLLTSAGSFRNVGDKLLVAMGTFDKLAMRIGLGRRAANILDLTPQAYMELRARERAREREAQHADMQTNEDTREREAQHADQADGAVASAEAELVGGESADLGSVPEA